MYFKRGNDGGAPPRLTKGVRLANWLSSGEARIGVV